MYQVVQGNIEQAQPRRKKDFSNHFRELRADKFGDVV